MFFPAAKNTAIMKLLYHKDINVKRRSLKLKKLKSVLTGAAAGFINGFFGSGGGTIAIFSMENFLNIPAKKSHATAISLIFPLSAISAAIYIFKTKIPWAVALPVTGGSVIGALLGAVLLKKISPYWLHKIFALFMLWAGIRMII